MSLQQQKTRGDLLSETLKSLYSIEGSSDGEKIEGIRLALINLLETERRERESDMMKPVA
jgi:hypothetical protein